MDLMAMMGKMKETQQKIKDTKKRLDTVFIDEESADGLLKVSISANNAIKNVTIDDALLVGRVWSLHPIEFDFLS